MNAVVNFNTGQIEVRKGDISFNSFEELKLQALNLSDQIADVEVTEENIKVSKKMLAAVNKRIKDLEDRRISIKKEMLEPYIKFESQVKEIVNIVKDADNLVRNQVREMEEQERVIKRNTIQQIYEKRIKQYSFGDVFTFDDFITTRHLNKSTSMKLVETSMVEWLEKKEVDMQVIKSLPNTHDVLMEYIDTKNLAIALNNVKQHEKYRKQLEQAMPKDVKKDEQIFVITLTDGKDLKLVELFMQQNEIKYNLQKGDY